MKDLETLQLTMLRRASKEQRLEIASMALLMHDIDTAKHLIKHYSTELDVFTVNMLTALIAAADVPQYTH